MRALAWLALAPAWLPGLALAAEIGVAPATRKVLPGTSTPATAEASLQAARNEWEAFQIVIRDAAGLAGVDVALSDLCDGAACVPASSARLYRELYLDVVQASPSGVTLHERETGQYPDPLIPLRDPYAAGDVPCGAPFDLAPGETGTVFVDLYVPPGTAPGTYTGSATVTAAAGLLAELAVSLEVWELDVPQARTVATAFKLLESGRGVSAYHGGTEDAPNGKLELIRHRYNEALHEHRLDPTYINGPIDWPFDADDNLLPVDWTEYDAAVGPWLDGTKFGDGIKVTRFDVHRFRPGKGLDEMTDKQYRQAAQALAEHLEQRGWWERAYVYSTDEPWGNEPLTSYPAIAEDVDRLVEISELWRGKALVTSPFDERIEGRIGIWCPDTTMYEDWGNFWSPYAGRELFAERFALGEELWFYTCRIEIPPYAGYDIDTAIGYEPRMVNWGAFYEHASGLLYWCVNYWHEYDPYRVFGDFENESNARNGNGILIYPGDSDGRRTSAEVPDWLHLDGPIVSYRLKQIRDGLEDWEIFRLGERLGAGEYVRQQVARAYARFGDCALLEDCEQEQYYCADDQPWTLDEQVLFEVREAVAAKILFLQFPEKYPDPEAEPLAPSAGDSGCGCSSGRGAPRGTDTAAWALLLALAILGRRRAR